MLLKYFYKALQKKWTDEDVKKFIGKYEKSYLAYANDENIRRGGASGGAVTAILTLLLEKGIINGALVCVNDITGTSARSRFFIADNKNDLLLAQGSQYIETGFVKNAISLIKEFKGKIAVVGLPCDIRILRKKISNNPELKSKVFLMISLFCGHNSQTKLIDSFLEKLLKRKRRHLDKLRFRIGLWRGKMILKFKDDTIMERKFSEFSLYQNLFFFAERKCLSCNDHFGYEGDLNIGDIWSYHLKGKDIKYSCIITKTLTGRRVLEDASRYGSFSLSSIGINDVLDGQNRGAPAHYNVSARHKVGKLLGISIPDKVNCEVKWHEYLVAFIMLLNWKWSQSQKLSWLIYKIPRPVLKIYLFLFKGLESLK